MKQTGLIIAFMFFALQIQAQSFGIKAGLNFADLSGTDAKGYGGITSFHIGVVREIEVFKSISLQPEVLFSTQGAKANGEEYKLNYITLPLLLKVNINAFSVEAGPQIGLLVGKSKEFDADVNTFDFGWAAGLEYIITGGLFAQARYGWSAKSIADDADIKNSVFQLSLGYTF